MQKPMLTSNQLVQHMIDKGILFTIISEENAKRHLSEHNNYFKLTSYRKNYTKHTSGNNSGKYERLEFAYLRELARLDMEIRHILLDMALDIEHFMKVLLLKEVEERMSKGEDGYNIVSGFLFDEGNPKTDERADHASKRAGAFHRKVDQNKKNPYCSGLTKKYADEMPVWAYVELISFGDLKELIEYYSTKTGWIPPVDVQSLERVRQIRNACAHGNAIINDLKPAPKNGASSVAPAFITQFLANAGISRTSRSKKLSNPRINQIVHLLYSYDRVVTSSYTRQLRVGELKRLINFRIPQHRDYFSSNALLVSTFEFFKKIIDRIN